MGLRLIRGKKFSKTLKIIAIILVALAVLSFLLILATGSYYHGSRVFKKGSAGIPFFSFDKYNYNLNVPSTMFIETSALIGISASLASRAMSVAAGYIFGMLMLALVFGRAFCGWVCPLGTLNHGISYLNKRFSKKKFPKEPFMKYQKLKYFILVVILVSAFFGVTLTGFFDPFAILPRSATVNAFPSARSIFETSSSRKTPKSSLSSNTEASTGATPRAQRSSSDSSRAVPSPENTSGEEVRVERGQSSASAPSDVRTEGSSSSNQAYPPAESGGSAAYTSAPDRRSLRAGSRVESQPATSPDSSSSAGANPYAGAPDRRSLRAGSRVESQAATASDSASSAEANPYGNAPDRRSLRAGSRVESQPATSSDSSSSANTTTSRAGSVNSAPDRRSLRQSRGGSSASEAKEDFFSRIRKWVIEKTIFYKNKRHYNYYALNGIFILIIFGLNFVRTRFWCRYLCGLGALYGAVGKYSVIRISQNDNCTNCGACAKFCQGACNPDIKGDFKTAECIYCFNCLKNCKFDALDVTFSYKLPEEKALKQVDLDKRSVIAGIGAGLASMFLFKTNFNGKRVNPALVRPPGALNEIDFLAKCIKCGNCIRSCPNNFLQPTFMEAGIAGMFTPMGVAKKGFCSPSCTLCSHVCPTGAIRYLTEKDRGTDPAGLPKMKIGTASVRKDRCITYVYEKKCLVCEEHCPTSPKAIWKRETTLIREDGKKVTIGQPRVNPNRCIGCGVCEHVCPVVDQPGIFITSVGETRNPKNEFSLTRQ